MTATKLMQLVTFLLNVIQGLNALIWATLGAVIAFKDFVLSWELGEKENLRFLRKIGALTTMIVNAGKMQFEKKLKK